MKQPRQMYHWTVLLALAVVLIIIAATTPAAEASGNHDKECEHPRFVEHGCGDTGPPGKNGKNGKDGRDGVDGVDGVDGKDGRDGVDGVDGKDGKDGIDGIDGIDGKDGEIPTEWITETRTNHITARDWYESARDAAAASAAMQVHLPQYQKSRLTFSGAHVAGTSGIGVGYAYMLDNDRNAGLTLAVGYAGDETAVRGSFGFEFGGDRPIHFDLSALIPTAAPDPEPVPTGQVILTEGEYEDLIIAQVQQEELDDYAEQAEYRYAQQQSLLEELQQKHVDDEAEIERLKIEAEALRKRQESDEALRDSVRQRILLKRKEDAERNESDSK